MERKANEVARLCTLAVDAIGAGRFDAASDVCDRLEREYPEEVDGLELRARLHEARGDTATAAQTYRRALDFTLTREHFDFEEELRNSYRGHIARLEALTAHAEPDH